MLQKTLTTAGKGVGARFFSLIIALRRRAMCVALVLCALLTLAPPGYAANNVLTMDKCERSSQIYTPGDFAAARLAVYGILEERFRTPQEDTNQPIPRPDAVRLLWKAFGKSGSSSKTETVFYSAKRTDANKFSAEIPFTDILTDYMDAIQWALESGVTHGVSGTEFDAYNINRRAFVVMLLNALGYQRKFDPAAALDFADSIGLTPVGLSQSFTLGDAALYLQCAASLTLDDGTNASELMNIPDRLTQEPFPATLCVTPYSVEDAEALLRDATCHLAETVLINGEHLTKDELLAFFSRYFMRDGENWHTSRMRGDYAPDISMDTISPDRLSDWERMDFNIIMDSLRADWTSGKLSDLDYMRESELERIRYLSTGKTVTVRFLYNEAWELFRDLDDAFTLYQDDRITQRADSFYRAYVADADGDFDVVRSAEAAIVNQASYADPKGYEDGEPYYDDTAHSVLGFFRSHRIVCDGYAKLFQYLTLRAGMDCVTVSGSTKSASDAEDGLTDHAWNKVKVNGAWLNEDVCWIDTAFSQTYSLGNDEHYKQNRHWAVNFTYL